MQKSGQINGGGSSANNDEAAPPEALKVVVTKAVRQQLGRQVGELRWKVFEVRDPDRRDDTPCGYKITVFELYQKVVAYEAETSDTNLLEFRHHALPKGQPIGRERFKTYRKPHVGVVNPALGAEALQGKLTLRIVNVRREGVRLQPHPFRHMGQPTVHWTTENPMLDAALPQVRRNGEPVRACA